MTPYIPKGIDMALMRYNSSLMAADPKCSPLAVVKSPIAALFLATLMKLPGDK